MAKDIKTSSTTKANISLTETEKNKIIALAVLKDAVDNALSVGIIKKTYYKKANTTLIACEGEL
ncbi:MAG: hypothetical protein HN975_06135 [Anaerolineae bacterium]|jgi:hypothetical protein|nr:hypothetical protein [Anaerolineae bacterium]